MFQGTRWRRFLEAGCAAALMSVTTPAGAQAMTFSVLHTFTGAPYGDGGNPYGGLIEDTAGNLYGTTAVGGENAGCQGYGCGTVFKIAADGTETILYAFTGAYKKRGTDGAQPQDALIEDASGNLYGTTTSGGDTRCGERSNPYGCGIVFRIAPNGAETELFRFTGNETGAVPFGSLLLDVNGDLFGTTNAGGNKKGTVFELAPDGTEKLLHVFGGGKDGIGPAANVIADSAGNLYGTTAAGGGSGCGGHGCGTVFQLKPDGQEKVVYAFQGGKDGAGPFDGLIMDKDGNLYGTTHGGGGSGCSGNGCGTVFKVTPGGRENIVYAFQGGSDGAGPFAGLTADASGNLYGTTQSGGGAGACDQGCGTVFEIVNGTTEQVLHAFTDGSDGAGPAGGVLVDANGTIFGTALLGGTGEGCEPAFGCGVVFKLSN